ncbi:putative Ig domain-containing protein [Puniceicoccus vermicola]|uniref:LTD domain-containing protein n=1 Tax=Puniceicoccus vermicola TaxID=388746 RepID=A0A7X1E584_9BACT|nr:putative Ig domain-containing protein [Puniceicoccus vermicola]MBC2603395.1 hypothetical protein [Puniceicoccus vermicola]
MKQKLILLSYLICTICASAGSVLLNEYNAVADGNLLDDGSGSDSFFGTVAGNGGDWIELVVVGDGTSSSTVDMRGWTIELFDGDGGASQVVLSQDSYWSNVSAGTILTFIENDSSSGGSDTEFERINRLNSEGWAWTNVYLGDPALIDAANSNLNIHVSNSDTDVTVKDSSDNVIFGPAGESISEEGVNSEEVFALQANPSPSIAPTDGAYNDISNSSFGGPNIMEDGSSVQSFLPFRTPGSAPTFTIPIADAELVAGNEFVVSTAAADDNGGNLTFTLKEAPEWLSLDDHGDGTAEISGIPSDMDAGIYSVELLVEDDPSDGSDSMTFQVRVFPSSSPVILNEYDGGGEWVELVVVGDGTPGAMVDLRGWIVRISEEEESGIIEFSEDDVWSSVQAGTILLFSEENAASGGFDTDLNAADYLADSGWGSIHVWIGDEIYLNAATTADSLPVSNDDCQIAVEDDQGNTVFGPAGEGIASEGGVNDEERFQLRIDPAPSVSPIGGNYGDSDSSTPGEPNEVAGGSVQNFEAFATGSDPNSPPYFTTEPTELADYTVDIPNEYFRIVETDDPNPSDSLTLTLIEGPDWLELDDYGDGTADLFGSPSEADAGASTVTVEVSDGSFTAIQTFVLFAFNETSPVIVNEFNAVEEDTLLDSGESEDSFWGAVEGNGGDWLELVVVGDGTAESTVDMRGWIIEIAEGSETPEKIVLSQNVYWQSVRAGTILTFGDRGFDEGGLDSGVYRVSRFTDEGWGWTHVLVSDSIFVDPEGSNFGSGFSVGSSDTRITLKDPSGSVRFGPDGEEFLAAGGAGSDEVYKLEQDPLPTNASPLLANYTDGSSSTFGAPNVWDSGSNEQDFSHYQSATTPNAEPYFTFISPQFARRGDGFEAGISASDFDGISGLTLTLVDGPSWLSLSDQGEGVGNLVGIPPESASLGIQSITVSVSDGQAIVEKDFSIFVMTSSSPVLVNEYNAVDSDNFLNGGVLAQDDDGGVSSDPVFGRVEGNGGDWIELVVVGDGGPGSVDLRGWTIALADNASSPFVAEEKIVLSQDSFWSAVPSGSILTFTEKRASEGGFDTNLDAFDQSDAEGWRWSNIWIGDGSLIQFSDELTNGYSRDSETGEVSGVSFSANDSWIVLYNSDGEPVFGPVGEGIAPESGVGGTEVFELEGDPTPFTSPLVQAEDAPQIVQGYDDGSTSSFGRPNRWDGDSVIQDFTPFIPGSSGPDPLSVYLSGFGLSGNDLLPNSDSDGDGAVQIEEFAFGTDPTSGGSSPQLLESAEMEEEAFFLRLTFLRRTGGSVEGDSYWADGIAYTVLGSLDLNSWNERVKVTTNPVDLPEPPANYEWSTYQLSEPISVDSISSAGFLRVLVGAEPDSL